VNNGAPRNAYTVGRWVVEIFGEVLNAPFAWVFWTIAMLCVPGIIALLLLLLVLRAFWDQLT